jgi:hypothetical protein
MQSSSLSISQPTPSPKEAIPYSLAALRQDLERVRNAWNDCQASRDRNAIGGIKRLCCSVLSASGAKCGKAVQEGVDERTINGLSSFLAGKE